MKKDEMSNMTAEEQGYLMEVKTRRRKLSEAFTPDVFKILEDRFETDLPCFQDRNGTGQWDPLDAMRRDAYRELLLWVKHEIEQYNHTNHVE